MLREHLNTYVIAYLDDILIYSKSLKEHREHVRSILTILKNNDVHLALAKCS